MMEIVATSDLIRPKPTYNPRIITSRFSPHRESPSSPYNQYLPKSASSPHFATSPRQMVSEANQVKLPFQLPAVTIPFVTHHGFMYATQSPKGLMMPERSSTSPTGCTAASPSTTPTTPLPTTPATPAYLQQPTPTRPTPKKIYTCKLCGKTFNNSGNFSRHQKVHTGEKPYRCEICGKAFTQSSTLKRHILSHSGDRSYKCQVCSKGYVDPWSLKKHMKNHGFNTYSHVQVKPILPHYKFHPPNVVLPNKGHMSQPWGVKPEITPPGLYLPLTSEQASPTLPFKSGGSAFTQVESKLAKAGFPQGFSLKDHDKKEGDDSEVSEEIKSEHGPISSTDAIALYMLDTIKQNIKINQETKDPECKENDNIMQFSSGAKTLPEKENEVYTCDKCGRSFNNINNFKTHQVIHAGSLACNGELACHQCKAVFITKQQLQSHMSTHTSSYWCVYCERSFRNEYNFKQHQTVHTTLVQEGDKKYPTWLESFRQEMMTCVTSLDTPQITLPPMSALTSHSMTPMDGESCTIDIAHDKRRNEMKAMKLKAMMDIDPLGHAIQVPKFCPASTAPFYSMGSAGSSYSAASLSAGSSRSSVDHYGVMHDPLARHPQSAGGSRTSSASSSFSLPHSAGTMPHSGSLPHPGGFAHPKPIKVEPNIRRKSFEEPAPRRPSLEESTQAFKRTMQAEHQRRADEEVSRQQKACEEAALRQHKACEEAALRQHKASEETAAREEKGSGDQAAMQERSEAMETNAPVIKREKPAEAYQIKTNEANQEKEESKEQDSTKEVPLEGQAPLEASEDEPNAKRARNITYQCCLCDYNSGVLSSLTSHLEVSHSLVDYELIKMLLACLGDIGA